MIRLIQKHSLLCISLLITALVYAQGLPGDFIFDDRSNIVDNKRLQVESLEFDALVEASFSSGSGVLKRPVSMLTFAVNHAFTGLSPVAMKITNIVIHLFNGILVFWLVNLLLDALSIGGGKISSGHRTWIPVITTIFWLLSPYQVSTVLYVVQRMTALMCLFSLLSLTFWLQGRINLLSNKAYIGTVQLFLSLVVFLPLAVLSKENGLLVIPLITLVEVVILNRVKSGGHLQPNSSIRFINDYRSSILLGLIITVVLGLFLLSQLSYFTRGYSAREFNLDERVITQFRVMMIYLRDLILPNINQLHFFHDEISISQNMFSPPEGFLGFLILSGLLILAWKTVDHSPLLCLGILFYMVGHLMESTILPLELFYEHRNYLPAIGLFLTLSLVLFELKRKYRIVGIVIIACIILNTIGSTFLRAQDWSSLETFYEREYLNNKASPRANYHYAQVLVAKIRQDGSLKKENFPKAKTIFLEASRLDPNDSTALIGLLKAHREFDEKIDKGWLNAIKEKLLKPPLTHQKVRDLRFLVDCVRERVCEQDLQFIQEIFDELVSYYEDHGIISSQLYWLSAQFYYQSFNDRKSYQLLMKAYRNSPEKPHYLLEAIRIALDAKKFQLVKDNLEVANDMDLSFTDKKFLLDMIERFKKEAVVE